MSVESTLVDYYAQRAHEYERIYEKPERQEELQRLKDLLRVTLAGRDVLEIACGTGYWTEVAATSAGSVTAFDINEAVLEIARGKRIEQGKVTFQVGDAYLLPSLARRFNGALGAFWWSHVPKQRRAGFLQEFHHALLPGAAVVFMDNTFVPGESTPLCRTDAQGNTYQMRRLSNGQTFEVLKNHPGEAELREAVSAHAEQVHLHWMKHYWWLSYRCKSPGPSS